TEWLSYEDIGRPAAITLQIPAQLLKQILLANAGVFGAQPLGDALQQGEHPASFENRLRCFAIGCFKGKAGLEIVRVQRKRSLAPAPLLGLLAIPLVSEEVI